MCVCSEAEKVSEVARIQYDRMIMERNKQAEMSEIENRANLARTKTQADADFYQAQKLAESNKVWVGGRVQQGMCGRDLLEVIH